MIDLKQFEVGDEKKFSLAKRDPDATPGARREEGDKLLAKHKEVLIEQQQRLFASGTHGVLLVLQAMDTGGKDGTVRHVFSGVNPQGVDVYSFKAPSAEELSHDFLWRIHKVAPGRGRIAVFNRSHYEDVLVVKVHQDKFLPAWLRGRKGVWKERYAQINDFERNLTENNIVIVKCYLHISRDEQRERFEKRLADKSKNWKFNAADLAEREHWEAYAQAYEEAIAATSTKEAPWYVIPANKKWYRNIVIAQILAEKMTALKLEYPAADPAMIKAIEEQGIPK